MLLELLRPFADLALGRLGLGGNAVYLVFLFFRSFSLAGPSPDLMLGRDVKVWFPDPSSVYLVCPPLDTVMGFSVDVLLCTVVQSPL